MTLTFLRHARQQPPVGPLKLDLGHSMAQALKMAVLFNDNGNATPFDPVSGTAWSFTAPAWQSTSRGPVASFNGTSGVVYSVPTFDYTTSFTVACWTYRTLAGTTRIGIAGNRDSGGTNGWLLTDLADFPSIQFGVLGNGTLSQNLNSTKSLQVNAWSYVVAWYDSVGLTLGVHLDGVDYATSTVSAALTKSAANSSIGYNTNNGYFQGYLGSVMIWNRVLSANERISLFNEPYQMFQTRPVQRWFVPPVAAGIPPGLGPVVQMEQMFHLDSSMFR